MARRASALLLAVLLAAASSAPAGTLRVPSEYPTIRSAASAAVAGDTILVAPGVYDENAGQGVHLFRGVALLSEGGREATTVIGPGLETGFGPPNLGCLVDGFRFTTEPDQGGVDVYNAGRGTTIARCRFEGLRFGGNNFESMGGTRTTRSC